jgi:hypothetical protein
MLGSEEDGMPHEEQQWEIGPFGLDARRAATFAPERTVLAVVHHMTAATRLADIMPLLEADRRIQVVYACAPGSASPGWTAEYLERLGAVVIPWQQATQTQFDLAVAASYPQLERLHAPVLHVPHGIGFNKYLKRWEGAGPAAGREMCGLERAALIHRGRVVPSAMVVPTERDLQRLRQGCPEAAPVASVAGDPAFDRLAASVPARELYRQALGAQDRTLVVVSSTWGPGSLLQRWPDLLGELTSQLPADSYRVAAIAHPHVWAWCGRRQLRAWLAETMRAGLVLLPPEEGWRAALAAADCVIGDHGSVTCYAAAIGRPVALASLAAEELDPACTVARLGRMAPRIRPGKDLTAQLGHVARAWTPARHRVIRDLVTSAPGRSAVLIRTLMYQLLNLAEPGSAAIARPVPAPQPLAALEGT